MMKLMYTEAVADCDSALALDESLAKAYFRKVCQAWAYSGGFDVSFDVSMNVLGVLTC